jgi:3-hydroxyisobutyrate dehydrogenase-like beta-hydroxyacid dehydrogenase
MKFGILLWILAKKLIRANRNNASFKKEVSMRDLIFQLKTVDNRIIRNFVVHRGNIKSSSKAHPKPDFTISFRDPGYGFAVLTSRQKNAFVTGVLEGNITIDGAFPLIIWFQNLIGLMKSGAREIPDHIKRIGFVGTGLIGAPMVRTLLRSGFTVMAYDINPEALQMVVKDGAVGCSSLADLTDVEIVIVMVHTMKQVEDVVFGLCEILPEGIKQTIVIMSTVSPVAIIKLRDDLNRRGRQNIDIVDAPVSGAPLNAEAGKLSIMVGGEKRIYDRIKPVMESMGENIFHMGSLGKGASMKLVNNIIGISGMLNTIEALSLRARKGLDPELMARVINAGAAKNFITEQWVFTKILIKLMLEDTLYNARGALFTTGLKDLETARGWAKESNIPTPCVDDSIKQINSLSEEEMVSLLETILGKSL